MVIEEKMAVYHTNNKEERQNPLDAAFIILFKTLNVKETRFEDDSGCSS
ncbi:22960_t:CDS:2 [Cetraspora pellucida]|uniref:22960_t:CDS:1 n=1 Tax=Cetraspora pellucida TaxID=1433469 RepID=A0A9N9D304_9GLOM|nr:22960_t:CDS:2 [Cetraspora pellucida]